MAKSDQDAIDRVFAGVGKALEAYERTLRPAPLPLDAYAHGDMGALASAQKDGLLAFFDAGCASCHWGPRLTDDGFHTLRLPTGRHDGQPDPGRMAGIELFDHSEFRADGAFSDAPGASGRAAPKVWDWTLGAFKTPALRGVASTAPYGHGGTSATLADVVEMHRVGGLDESDQRAAGITDRWLPPFDAATGAAILPFLETLTLDVQP